MRNNRRMLPAAFLLVALLIPVHAFAVRTETKANLDSMTGQQTILSEDTSAANAELILTVPARDYARRLMSVQIICSASTTITVTQKITRTITSGTVDALLPDIPLTATTSGAMYSDIFLNDADTVTVTVPAAGGGITCSALVTEEVK